jgi:hypothetical protein
VTDPPWVPDDLPFRPGDDPSQWHYVVLEEMVDGFALLLRWNWPMIDPLGHLVWPANAEADSVTASAGLLRTQLYSPNGIQRVPRIGDVFAVRGGSGRWRGRVADLRTLLAGADVYDVSASARGAAKVAYLASLGALQTVEDGSAGTAPGATGPTRGRLRERRVAPAPPPSPVPSLAQLPRLQIAAPPEPPANAGRR